MQRHEGRCYVNGCAPAAGASAGSVAQLCTRGRACILPTENGLIGTGPIPEEGVAHRTLTDAGGRHANRNDIKRQGPMIITRLTFSDKRMETATGTCYCERAVAVILNSTGRQYIQANPKRTT